MNPAYDDGLPPQAEIDEREEAIAEEVRLHELAQSLTVGAVMTAIRTGRPIIPLSVDTLKREVNATFHRTVAR